MTDRAERIRRQQLERQRRGDRSAPWFGTADDLYNDMPRCLHLFFTVRACTAPVEYRDGGLFYCAEHAPPEAQRIE